LLQQTTPISTPERAASFFKFAGDVVSRAPSVICTEGTQNSECEEEDNGGFIHD
jgi:hypothetical protein